MTDGFNVIKNVSKNFSKKLNLSIGKLIEERINIEVFSEELTNINDGRFDNGAPLLLDIKALMKFDI